MSKIRYGTLWLAVSVSLEKYRNFSHYFSADFRLCFPCPKYVSESMLIQTPKFAFRFTDANKVQTMESFNG